MKSARLLAGMLCGVVCLALFSGCETQQSACEREKRLTERMEEMQVELDGRMMGMGAEMASMRANPPVIVQQVPAPMPEYNAVPSSYAQAPAQPTMQVDTISIEDDFYSASKKQQLEQLAASQRSSYTPPPPARSTSSASANTNRIRVPVPARTVQAALKEAGYYNGALDGKVGKGTIAAITNFQRDQGIKADGIVGRQTWQLLYPYVPAGMSTTRLK